MADFWRLPFFPLLPSPLSFADVPNPAAADSAERPAPASLAEQLRQLCSRPEFASATWGICVARANTDGILCETNSHKLLKPASCAKLFTAALALDRLGPQFRIRTDLVPLAQVTSEGVLQGDLAILGRGDFSLAARFLTNSRADPLQPFAEALTRAGIRRIEGGLVADDSFLGGSSFGTGWTWDDLRYYYGAEVDALTVDDNVIDLELRPGASEGDPVLVVPFPATDFLRFDTSELRTGPTGSVSSAVIRRRGGSVDVRIAGRIAAGGAPWKDAVPVPEPARYFLTRLHRVLESRGIPVRGGVRVDPGVATQSASTGTFTPPVSVESPPMSELIRFMLKPSQNLYAQLLLLQCGSTEPGRTVDEDLESRGLRVLQAFLRRAGIPDSETLLDDGSGLSRSSLVTPAALVQLLRLMDRHPHGEVFFGGLPVSGVDGTLRTRFRGTAAEGNLRAKTGSLRHVNTLAGYVTNRAGHRLAFALMLNAYQSPAGAPSGREAIDLAAELVARSSE